MEYKVQAIVMLTNCMEMGRVSNTLNIIFHHAVQCLHSKSTTHDKNKIFMEYTDQYFTGKMCHVLAQVTTRQDHSWRQAQCHTHISHTIC